MFTVLRSLLWSNISDNEAKKFGLLASIFFFVVGTYWLLRPLKESIFFHTVGSDWQPTAKKLTIVLVFCLVLLYGALVDYFHRHTIFYFIGALYGILFFGIWYAIGHPVYGLANTVLSPQRYLGWFAYLAIESFGYFMAAHFWSFVASSTDSAGAKRGYPLIVTFAQLGSIVGSLFAYYAAFFRNQTLMLMGIAGIVAIVLLVRIFIITIPYEERTTEIVQGQNLQKRTGFLEGLKLLCTRPYLMGIFCIVLFFDMVNTIVDYQLLKQAMLVPAYASPTTLTSFMGLFGICVNTVSFLFALIGTSYIMRRFGLVFCLLAFPVCLAMAILTFYSLVLFGTFSNYVLLWLLFGVMVLIKSLSYALNNPSKEMMYVPTSRDAKFKAKSWIDMFGARSAKAAGAQINGMLARASGGHLFFLQTGSLVSLTCIFLWIAVAFFVGRKFQRLTRSGQIVE